MQANLNGYNSIVRKLHPATPKQTWAIFCMTGWDVRNCELGIEQASGIIEDLKNGKPFFPEHFNGARQIKKLKPKNSNLEILYAAQRAGEEAAKNCKPIPMIVEDTDRQYYVPQGVCGFAWVKIRPGNCSFANFLKKSKLATKSYTGGVDYYIHAGGQSYEIKRAYASAFAKVLQEYGIDASTRSRLD